MSASVTLYTPGTGLPDFETRIALGLVAAALQATDDPNGVRLDEQGDRFVVTVDSAAIADIGSALGWACANRLAEQVKLLHIPGFRPLHLDKQSRGIAAFRTFLLDNPENLARTFAEYRGQRAGAQDSACGHRNGGPKLMDALLAFSPQLGQPPKRNQWASQKNLPLCPSCCAAALAGTFAFQAIVDVRTSSAKKKTRFSFLPRFRGTTTGDRLARYMTAVQFVRAGYQEDIAARSHLLALLAFHPSLVQAMAQSPDEPGPAFFVFRADVSGNAARYGYQAEQDSTPEVRFLSHSVQCRAAVQHAYQSRSHRSELMGSLTVALQERVPNAACDFCRTNASAHEKWPLVHEDVALYLAGKEVCSVHPKLLGKDGPEFDAIRQVADMLKFFVRQRNFGHVDNLRKARDVSEFSRLLADVQREAQSIMLDPKKRDKPYLPSQDTIRQVLDLANESDAQRRDVQTLVALLSFTHYRKEE